MSGDNHRASNEARGDFDGARDFLAHHVDPRVGRERVRRHCAGPPARQGARGEMRPHFAAELQPVAAMNEHQKTLWRGFGQKEVEPVALSWAIRDGGPGALVQSRAKSGGFLYPARRKCFGPWDEGAVGVSAIVIHWNCPRLEAQLTAL